MLTVTTWLLVAFLTSPLFTQWLTFSEKFGLGIWYKTVISKMKNICIWSIVNVALLTPQNSIHLPKHKHLKKKWSIAHVASFYLKIIYLHIIGMMLSWYIYDGNRKFHKDKIPKKKIIKREKMTFFIFLNLDKLDKYISK